MTDRASAAAEKPKPRLVCLLELSLFRRVVVMVHAGREKAMSNVVSYPQAATQELIRKLVRAGYLQHALCNDPVAVANAIARLKQALRGEAHHESPEAA